MKVRVRESFFYKKTVAIFPQIVYTVSVTGLLCVFGAEQGRTNRGVSGALYLQSAIAGVNSRPRLFLCVVCVL